MLRTLFIEEARTQVGRNASVTGACCLSLDHIYAQLHR